MFQSFSVSAVRDSETLAPETLYLLYQQTIQ